MKLTPLALGVLLASAALAQPPGDWMSGFKPFTVKEPAIPSRTVSLPDFGAVPGGRALCTDAFARAIDALAAQGGGRLLVPAGLWLTGPIALKSNIEIHTERGTLVQFSKDVSLYKLAPGSAGASAGVPGFAPEGRRRSPLVRGLITGENLENVAITGPGVFDGGGEAWRPVKKSKTTEPQWQALLASGGVLDADGQTWSPRTGAVFARPHLLVLSRCRRVLLEDATFENSPAWNLNPSFCDDVTIRRVTVLNPWYAQNGDGLDLESCRDVVIRDDRLDVGDDGLCMKSGAGAQARKSGRATENVLIENCVVYHAHGGFTIGSEMSGGVRNIRVDNCLFLGTDVGLRFKTTRGRGGVVEDIYVSNIRMTNIGTDAISFDMYYQGAAPGEEGGAGAAPKPVPVSDGTPQFRNLYIENITCLGARRAVQLQGLPEMPIRGIRLRDISISAERGLLCEDADDITLDHVQIASRSGEPRTFIRSQNVRTFGPPDPARPPSAPAAAPRS
ncbi:MAG TPA: glycoside hydrolase family 28 protein [Opitutaceae bacterium]|nr:glycoside hydrolase family 28 protein [Opitutaceae bacterium]